MNPVPCPRCGENVLVAWLPQPDGEAVEVVMDPVRRVFETDISRGGTTAPEAILAYLNNYGYAEHICPMRPVTVTMLQAEVRRLREELNHEASHHQIKPS